MKRAFPADIAKATGVSASWIRRLADSGTIEMKRDFHGWRWTDNPLKAIKIVRGLLDTKNGNEPLASTNDTSGNR